MLYDHKRENYGILAKLTEIADDGALKPLLDEKKFGFPEVARVYERLTSGQTMGKVVVEL